MTLDKQNTDQLHHFKGNGLVLKQFVAF